MTMTKFHVLSRAIETAKSFLKKLFRLAPQLPPVPKLPAVATLLEASEITAAGAESTLPEVPELPDDVIELEASPPGLNEVGPARLLPGTSCPLVSLGVCREDAPTVRSHIFEGSRD